MRIATGERYERLSSDELRRQLAIFASFPIFIAGLLFIGLPLLHGAGLALICLYFLTSLIVTFLLVVAWTILIPWRASVVVSVLLWIFVIWRVCQFDLAKF
jgi:hypothetical protein